MITNIEWRPRCWALGFEFDIGQRRMPMHQNVSLRVQPQLTIYLAPFKFEFGGNIDVLAFRCGVCGYEHGGEPALNPPIPGVFVCSACVERGQPLLVVMAHPPGCGCDHKEE